MPSINTIHDVFSYQRDLQQVPDPSGQEKQQKWPLDYLSVATWCYSVELTVAGRPWYRLTSCAVGTALSVFGCGTGFIIGLVGLVGSFVGCVGLVGYIFQKRFN